MRSVSPAAGPAAGGTEVTIRGTGFAAGLGVTIGGRAASDVTVRGNDMLTAKTPASATAGNVDIAVTLNGRTGTLAGGFRYDPAAPNTAPVIRSMTAQGRRIRQPSSFADYGETIQVALVVEDAESAPAQLTYQWRACGGNFVGTGPVGRLDSATSRYVALDMHDRGDGSRWTALPQQVYCRAAAQLRRRGAKPGRRIPRGVRQLDDSCRDDRPQLLEFVPGKSGRTQRCDQQSRDAQDQFARVRADSGDCGIRYSLQIEDCRCLRCHIGRVEFDNPTRRPAEIAKGTSTIYRHLQDSRWWLCDSLYDGASSLGLHFMH